MRFMREDARRAEEERERERERERKAMGIQVLARIAQRVRHFGYVIDVILFELFRDISKFYWIKKKEHRKE